MTRTYEKTGKFSKLTFTGYTDGCSHLFEDLSFLFSDDKEAFLLPASIHGQSHSCSDKSEINCKKFCTAYPLHGEVMTDYESTMPYEMMSHNTRKCIFKDAHPVYSELTGDLRIKYKKMRLKDFFDDVCDYGFPKDVELLCSWVKGKKRLYEGILRAGDEVNVVVEASMTLDSALDFLGRELNDIICMKMTPITYSILSMVKPKNLREGEAFEQVFSEASELFFKSASGKRYDAEKTSKMYSKILSRLYGNSSRFKKKVDKKVEEIMNGDGQDDPKSIVEHTKSLFALLNKKTAG